VRFQTFSWGVKNMQIPQLVGIRHFRQRRRICRTSSRSVESQLIPWSSRDRQRRDILKQGRLVQAGLPHTMTTLMPTVEKAAKLVASRMW
jgi:hypothetical protein